MIDSAYQGEITYISLTDPDRGGLGTIWLPLLVSNDEGPIASMTWGASQAFLSRDGFSQTFFLPQGI